jgi:hypothetical protein
MPYDLPSWLQAKPASEPFQAFLEGAQTGTAIKANQIRAAALAEEQRQFNEIQPLRTKLAEQQFELGKIKLKDEVKKQQDLIDSERAFTKVGELFSRHQALGIAGSDGSEAALGYAVANNPTFYMHPGAKDLMGQMFLARKSRDIADQREADATARAEQIQMQQAAQTERAKLVAESRTDVANIRSDAQVEAANIRAEASARSLLNTKEFQTFMARKQAIVSDVTMSLDKKFDAIKALEEQYNVTHKTDEGTHTTGSAPAVVPVPVTRAGSEIRPDAATAAPSAVAADPMPKSQAEFDAIPSGTWFINPADGKRMRKK